MPHSMALAISKKRQDVVDYFIFGGASLNRSIQTRGLFMDLNAFYLELIPSFASHTKKEIRPLLPWRESINCFQSNTGDVVSTP